MKTTLSCFALIALCMRGFGAGQPASLKGNLSDVHLSITITTRLLKPATTNSIQCRIENSSTNLIYIRQPAWEGTALSLIGTNGVPVPLTPPASPKVSERMAHPVKAGDVYAWTVQLIIPRSTPPGPYKLKASRIIYVPYVVGREIESNLLGVEVAP
jgi:hypothetical protein